MRRRFVNVTVILSVVLCLCFSANHLLAADPIINDDGNNITLENDVGCKLEIWQENGKYGLGTFYVQDVAMGKPIKYFLAEDNVWQATNNNRYQRLWPGKWDPYFQASQYKIIENTPDRGVIKFSGAEGKLKGSVTITLSSGSTGYKIDYDMKVNDAISHPLYVSGPFFPEKMQFVQYPFETPLVPPLQRKEWEIFPTRSTVPFMFGAQQLNKKDYYVGVGYQLKKEDYWKGGRIEYDGNKTGDNTHPFQIFYVSPHTSGWFRYNTYKLSIVISTAANQYDCISGYRKMSGYDISVPIRRSLRTSVKGVMDMYENTSAYVSLPPFKNKAYHHQIKTKNGAPPSESYGSYIQIGVNAQLAYQFYKYWQAHPEENWARKRALNMANFVVEVQNEDGSIPSLWDPQEKRFRTYRDFIDKRGYIYTTCRQAVGAYSLYRLYLARKESENVAIEKWKTSALKAMDYLVDKIQPNGFLGRSYNEKGEYDTGYAPNAVLIALDYVYARTGDEKYDEARARLEQWVVETFVYPNQWFGWSSDMGGWSLHGAGPPPWNTDALNSLSFATYCAYRHMRTGKQKYIDWAEHVISYNWLETIPVQYPGFEHVTKGLVREQDNYLCYDVPFRTTLFIDGFPYLSMLTGDRFFMDYYKLMVQTQMAYQNTGEWKSFNIGLWWNASGAAPRDEIGEPKVNYIVEFCSMFLESVRSPHTYRYVGGRNWGVGLDYELDFDPDFTNGEPYVLSSSSELTYADWYTQSNILSANLKGQPGSKGKLNVKLNPKKYPLNNMKIKIDGKEIPRKQFRYNNNLGALTINYTHEKPILNIQLFAR